MSLQIPDFPALVRSLTEKLGADRLAEEAGIPRDRLEYWGNGNNSQKPSDEDRIWGICIRHREFDELRRQKVPLPPVDFYNPEVFKTDDSYSWDDGVPTIKILDRPTTLGGQAGTKVNFPFGVSASIFMKDHSVIQSFSKKNFDILTFKTVRSRKRSANKPPHWFYLNPNNNIAPPFDMSLTVEPEFPLDNPATISTANSFGIPSEDPTIWMEEVTRSRAIIRSGQVLIVSVIGSSDNHIESEMIKDFCRTAAMAKSAGAQIIEANISSPNNPGECLYKDPEVTERLLRALRKELKDTPLFIKIGYLSQVDLESLVIQCQRYVQGFVGINAISMPVVDQNKNPAFRERERIRCGVSGAAIRPWAMEVARNLIELRSKHKADNDYSIIAVGGANTPKDVTEYFNLGVDAVESCTAAMLNPLLATQVRAAFQTEPGSKAAPITLEKESKQTDRNFASPEDQRRWEASVRAERLAAQFRGESGGVGPFRRIRLLINDDVSLAVLYSAGPVQALGDGLDAVPETTLRVLRALDIRFEIV